jgi:hypothetical protein
MEYNMTKVVINRCHGGFGLSKEACQRYWDIKGKQVWIEDDDRYKSMGISTVWLVPAEDRVVESTNRATISIEERRAFNEKYASQTWYERDVERDDPVLVQVVEELGEKADGKYACLGIVEIPDDVKWQISEYDGLEWVAEKHRIWV